MPFCDEDEKERTKKEKERERAASSRGCQKMIQRKLAILSVSIVPNA